MQYPIFGPRQDGYLQQAVSPLKDVEGLNFTWCVAFNLVHLAQELTPARQALLPLPQRALHRPSQARCHRPSPLGILRPFPLHVRPERHSRQGYPPLHPSRNRQDPRALSRLQHAAPVRKSCLWSHDHRGQQVRSAHLSSVATGTDALRIFQERSRRTSPRCPTRQRRRASLLSRPRRNPGVYSKEGRPRWNFPTLFPPSPHCPVDQDDAGGVPRHQRCRRFWRASFEVLRW